MNYIFDTNVILDLLEGRLPSSAVNNLSNIIAEVSVISKIELLGYHAITAQQQTGIQKFLQNAILHPLTEDIVDETIRVRKMVRIKVPDAIIAATAIEFGLVILTRNIRDFRNIPGLNFVDPILCNQSVSKPFTFPATPS